MRQTHMNPHINTIAIEHWENIKAVKTKMHTEIEQWTIFYANQYNNQATEKDDHADADHLYDTVEADGKGNDFQSKPL